MGSTMRSGEPVILEVDERQRDRDGHQVEEFDQDDERGGRVRAVRSGGGQEAQGHDDENSTAVPASTRGYRTEIGSAQSRHRPRSTSQETTGTLSGLDRGPTPWTGRCRPHHRQPCRDPVDDDVEERTDRETEHPDEPRNEHPDSEDRGHGIAAPSAVYAVFDSTWVATR